MAINEADRDTAEVLEFFISHLRWDIADKKVQNYVDTVAEYIDVSREAYEVEVQVIMHI